MTKDEALKLALEALTIWEQMYPTTAASPYRKPAITAIKEALAQPAQEACARCKDLEEQAYDLLGQLKVTNLKWSVAHPWVGLTGQEKAWIASVSLDVHDAVHRTDAKLKGKNI